MAESAESQPLPLHSPSYGFQAGVAAPQILAHSPGPFWVLNPFLPCDTKDPSLATQSWMGEMGSHSPLH